MTRFLARITRRRLAQSIAVALALPSAAPVLAQFRVEVSGVGLRQMPIVLPAFHGEDSTPTDRARPPQAAASAPVSRRGTSPDTAFRRAARRATSTTSTPIPTITPPVCPGVPDRDRKSVV